MKISSKKILLFGGTGSLGHTVITRYIKDNEIYNYSRDECKQWETENKFKSPKLHFILGDIRDYSSVERAILTTQPHIIIIASALKRIDRCEDNVNECFLTNYIGPSNVCNSVLKNEMLLKQLETVLFVSTDKACNPINTYGITKALAEKIMIESSMKSLNVKFVVIRYGNVLNSRGSIIPYLHQQGQDPTVMNFGLTHIDMTRFVMTLDQSVDLLEHAIVNGESGDVVIPRLISMRLVDLMELFSEKYKKCIKITSLRPGEKLLETLINESQAMSMTTYGDGDYFHIKPFYKNKCITEQAMNYSSNINTLSKEELRDFLEKLKLL